MNVNILSRKQLQWFEVRGLKVIEKHQGYQIIYPSRCPYLIYKTELGERIAVCQIQDCKPDICWDAKCPKKNIS
jgi:hypothetical protein